MQDLGRLLVVFGLVLAVVGGLLYAAPSLPLLGKLPGDLRIEGERWRIYLPITSCLVVSALLSLALHVFSRWR